MITARGTHCCIAARRVEEEQLISINILLHDFASVHHARMPLDRMLCCGFSK
jgi:hypothetical protein